MYHQHSTSYNNRRASVSPQHPKREIRYIKEENEKGDHFSTPVNRERATINYINQTPTKLHAHPPMNKKRASINYINHTPTKLHAHPPKERASINYINQTPTKLHAHPPMNKERASINYINQTPTKLHAHPPGWERITRAPKVCRKAVTRMDFGEIATATH